MSGTKHTLVTNLLSDQIFGILKQSILSGEYSAGDRLVELELARKYGVSQAPVREALRNLADTGLVTQIPRRGTFVEGVSQEAARDAYQIRAALEPVAVRDLQKVINDGVLLELEDHLAVMSQAAEDGDLAGVLEADIAFHKTIWEKSKNSLLPKIWPHVEKTWPLLEARLRTSTETEEPVALTDLRAITETHNPLIEALRTGDSKAPELFRAHVAFVWSNIEKISVDH